MSSCMTTYDVTSTEADSAGDLHVGRIAAQKTLSGVPLKCVGKPRGTPDKRRDVEKDRVGEIFQSVRNLSCVPLT